MSTPSKKSHIITLPLPPAILARFLPSNHSQSTTPPIKGEAVPTLQQPSPTDPSSSTPATTEIVDANSLAPPKPANGRKRGAAPANGRKRAPPSIDPNAPMRERARPGPKKKPRLRADGTIDHDSNAPNRPANVPAHRLGPKANTGAINAGLRALDRTGKPCRKWEKRGFQLKSFTGTVWDVPSWKAPPREIGDGKSDSGSSEAKRVQDSSNVPSEASRSVDQQQGGMNGNANGMDSSPVRAIAA